MDAVVIILVFYSLALTLAFLFIRAACVSAIKRTVAMPCASCRARDTGDTADN